jgi:hypothetical protein
VRSSKYPSPLLLSKVPLTVCFYCDVAGITLKTDAAEVCVALKAVASGLVIEAGGEGTPTFVFMRIFYVVDVGAGGGGDTDTTAVMIGAPGLACIGALQDDPQFACSAMPVTALEAGCGVAVQVWFQTPQFSITM